MLRYFIYRLFLIIPTFLGVTVLVFLVTRFVPGGPVERAIREYMMASLVQGQSGGNQGGDFQQSGQPLNQKQIDQLKKFYGLDKPVIPAYFHWLGKFLKMDLGKSTRYNDDVLEMIVKRIPISLNFGISSLIIVYLISIPLGISKALKHRSAYDNISSSFVFLGYALPGYIVGILLLSIFAFRLGILPLGGFESPFYAHMNIWGKMADRFKHMLLPLIAYVIGDFAVLTLMMKNNLMENMAADYIKTAVAKGRTFQVSMWLHAFRNSIIPIASHLGSIVTVFLAGSFLIEKIFNIRGMGMLGYQSLLARDYPVVMGVMALTAIASLIGNVLSDYIVSMMDPRIRLGK